MTDLNMESIRMHHGIGNYLCLLADILDFIKVGN